MTQISDIATVLAAYDPAVTVPGFDPSTPSTPDVQVPLSIIHAPNIAETLTNKELGTGSAFNPSGARLSGLLKGRAAPTVGSIAAGAFSDQAITVTGAVTGDIALVQMSSAFVAGIVIQGWWVSGADTVTVRLFNPTSGAIVPGAVTLDAVVLHFG